MGKFLDLKGKRFGRLTVVERGEDKQHGTNRVRWVCLCDCGNAILTTRDCLMSGDTKSCGCLRKDGDVNKRISETLQQRNEYNIDGEYGVGYLNSGEEFYFDVEDYEKIKDFKWNKSKEGYLTSSSKISGIKVNFRIHRLIMCPSDDVQIDHINHNTLDNRKCNLREVTNGQNRMNTKIPKNNTTGHKGVLIQHGKYRAYITVNKNKIHLGYFNEFEDACKAREEAEEKYFGEYACKN